VDANYKPVPPPTPLPTATPTPGTVFETGPGKYEGLWLAEMARKGNVWNGPGQGKILKSWWAGRRVLLYEGVTDVKGELWYRVSEEPEAPMYVQASMVKKVAPVKFEGARYKGRWVNINISQQVVTAYEDGTPVMVTLASTGTSKTPTELGVWKIFYRLPKQDMRGGSRAAGDYYYLKDVPYPQYFHSSGEGLHGTYWHDNFGRPMSHGCVNLSTPIAGWFYRWASIGTVVYTHY
ncbi:MAG TPA: L,D-transpeptidase, partial [Chloroflexia bacterium]|nr:L,D-transpeptidase [Chloroflexia bacterium]